MQCRRWEALVLVLLTGCASTPRGVSGNVDPYEAELNAVRYEVRVLTVGAVRTEPVRVDKEDFRRVMRAVAPEVRPSEQPQETARWLLEEELGADLVAELERGRVVRMVPLEEDSPLSTASNAAMVARYQRLCAERYGGGDCLGLTADGPVLDKADRRTLALAEAFGPVLQETRDSLQEMVNPQAVLSLLVGTAMLYFMLWIVPEPITKGVAALITLAFVAWLGAKTLWELMDGWARLVKEADRATTFEELQEAGRRFAKMMGENTARVVVLVVTAALGGGAARLSQKLPKLPGFERAAVQAEAQGARLSTAAEVEAVAVPAEGTFTLMLRSPGSRAATMAEARAGVTTIIRHQGGNRQVFINGQRWHVPAHRSVREIPTRDSVGEQLQAEAQRAAKLWKRSDLSQDELIAIEAARAKGQYLRAHLMERMARGKFVENILRDRFKQLRWSRKGVDAVDPATGYKYEILSGTRSNMELHGRRMADEFFRMITF